MKALVLQRTMEQDYMVLMRRALAVVHCLSDAEDAVQTACCKAWQHQQDIHSEQACLPWLLKIVFHESISILRQRSRNELLMNQYQSRLKARAADPDPEFIQVLIMNDAMSTLSDMYAVTLRMRYYEGCSIAEISQRLGIPAGTVNSRMHRGRQQLEKELVERAIQ